MAKKKAAISGVVLVGLGVAVWWFFFRGDTSSAGELASEVAAAKTIPIPEFGTDQIIDAADAIGSEVLTLPRSNNRNSSQ